MLQAIVADHAKALPRREVSQLYQMELTLTQIAAALSLTLDDIN
ncbi:MAG: hypothetical protein AAFO87_10230 [Cyanobacteria bacterium J06607_6]